MAVNNLTFNQAANLINMITAKATGGTYSGTVPQTEQEFVSVGQIALKTGYDPLTTAISQVLSETIFSVRPYEAKFKGLEASSQRYGAITRKLAVIDKDIEEDQKFSLVDGESIDHYEVKKPQVLQLNFYGANEYQDHLTIYTEQLDNAMTGSQMFGEFITMIYQNISDKLEQANEELARGTLTNLIGGILMENELNTKGSSGSRVIDLVDLFNDEYGTEFTTTEDIKQDNKWDQFVKFTSATIAKYSRKLEERSMFYHTCPNGDKLMKHTPKRDQRLYIIADYLADIKAEVLSGTYHDNYLDLIGDVEEVSFWSDPLNPYKLDTDRPYTFLVGLRDGESGSLNTRTLVGDTRTSKVLGIIMDRDAAGYVNVKDTMATTSLNAAGLYFNTYWHRTQKFWNSMEENAIVFVAGSTTSSGGGSESGGGAA